MGDLTFDEARSLGEVFGRLDFKALLLLSRFETSSTKYDAMKVLKELETSGISFPQSFSPIIPQSSLYRKVDELHEAGFLEIVDKKEFVRGTLEKPMNLYRLSLKGSLACTIQRYAFFLDPEVRFWATEYAKQLESMPGFPLLIAFLRWHKERRIDLSSARIDPLYRLFTTLMAMRDHPEDLPTPFLRSFAARLKTMTGDELDKDLEMLTEMAKQISESPAATEALRRKIQGQKGLDHGSSHVRRNEI